MICGLDTLHHVWPLKARRGQLGRYVRARINVRETTYRTSILVLGTFGTPARFLRVLVGSFAKILTTPKGDKFYRAIIFLLKVFGAFTD